MTWAPDKYFAKAQLYWAKATAFPRGSDDFLLRVAFVCEFVVRAALTYKNPALNAAVDGESILASCGITPQRPARTIPISEAIDRLQRLIPELGEDECAKLKVLVSIRNRELHDDSSELLEVDSVEIMPAVYSFMAVATNFAKVDLKNVLGDEDGALAIKVFEARKKDRKKRVSDLIRSFKDRFYTLSKEEQANVRKEQEPTYQSAVLKSGHHVTRTKCPACTSFGILVGMPVGRSAPMLRDNAIMAEIHVVPQSFVCKCCEMKVTGLDELMAAGFSHEYNTWDDIDPLEHFSIDPMDHVDVDEILREHAGGNEYMDE